MVQHASHCSPQVQLHTVRISVQQSSPAYHRSSAALTQLATDCSTLLDQCRAEAEVRRAAVELAASQPMNESLQGSSALMVKKGESSRLEVILEGLKLKIDDSEASCSVLSYSGATACVSVKHARANIAFKVGHCHSSSRLNWDVLSRFNPSPNSLKATLHVKSASVLKVMCDLLQALECND